MKSFSNKKILSELFLIYIKTSKHTHFMKEFRLSEDGLFICEECHKLCKNKQGLVYHSLIKHGLTSKQYFDKWIKEESDGKCKICGEETKLASSGRGYRNTCSEKCNQLYNDRIFELKYGVSNPAQNKELYEKSQKTSFRMKKYGDEEIWYQGKYELDFLEKYYKKYPEIQRGPTIKYFWNNKMRVYYPDFYIPSLKIIIECKNSYLAKKDKEMIEAKKKAVLSEGFGFILIINKNYLGVSI